ncbi:TonB-dependent receptor, putative [marine gamma proteobacterium HTCC2207]|jgi:TonB-dependent receptor|uniref:TonB-dependent receptor, putative n=1 Tax=gamma proteobacterium HTCC2207 TaxID=314287 RepID=Q1YUE7_9GAMM|nr:TonB-dependent receptor, putative [marine gamma proteobacterium HTCC2207] [gamma proteobacterium HTCC2207]MDC0589537.1 TonB-dependent receptor [Porticoccaceae bacterium]MDC3261069.1 TonB-dependent receptor [bacterium]MDG1079040.1 TonB-dependent receptor [Porticoccaceae bacterium]
MFRKSKLSVAILAAAGTLVAGQVIAEGSSIDEVVVTGIRGSLERAMDTKRDASGVVDAISAEDMGKFPDTNLAESLQRISGVSINRVNGEGSEVTVRGFGGGFNLVTLNGRQMPSANVGTITGNPLDQGASGSSRSFDFSNLASEGVRGLQVYKTGRASVATGGVGATINVETIRPLESGGTQASVGVKAVKDTSGDDVTPEVSGLYSWSNDDSTFGVSVFGSFQERDSGSRHASVEEFGLRTWDSTDPSNLSNLGIVEGATIINTPNDGQLVYRPTNLGLGFNEDKRERTNGLLTVQFAPNDSMTFTADAAYAENIQDSTSLVDGVWFNGTVDYVEYDGDPVVAAPVIFAEDVSGGKDFFFQNLDMGTKDTLESIGLNLDWNVSDKLNLRFDAASSEAKSGGNGPQGNNVLRMNVAGGNAGWQAVDFGQEIPQGIVSVDDSVKGNNNGIFDLADVGSQVTQFAKSDQVAELEQFNFDGSFVASDNIEVDFGVGFMSSEMRQTRQSGSNALGGWGVDAPGDIPEGLIEQVSSLGEFDYQGSGVAGVSQPAGETAPIALGSVSWTGDPLTLLNAMAPIYGLDPNNMPINSTADNRVEEDTISIYSQIKMDGEVGGMPINVVSGLRWEETDVTSTSQQAVPSAFIWESNNDFTFTLGDSVDSLSEDYSYSVLLPSLDISIDVTDNLKARASFSKTLARPGYSDMYTATSVEAPSRITHLGDQPSASQGNARLDPLESNNFDFSVEYYYGEANYFSVGFFQKNVSNFVGVQQADESLFGLRDATASNSTFLAQAISELSSIGVAESEDALFSMTAILQNMSDFTETSGAAAYQAAEGAASSTQAFHEAIFSEYDVTPVGTDPLIAFAVKSPTNSKTAEIYGFELASQHFFGETGFGYQFNYTTVEGDIGYENGSDPSEDQFALPGLSDTLNLVGIYEKDGLSARLAYNWRDSFLSQVNRSVGSTRNPEYTDSVEQLDLNVSYEFDSGVTVALDAINLTGEGQRKYGRNKNATFFVQELDPRYVFSARYTF